jgi:hypothetical protein
VARLRDTGFHRIRDFQRLAERTRRKHCDIDTVFGQFLDQRRKGFRIFQRLTAAPRRRHAPIGLCECRAGRRHHAKSNGRADRCFYDFL